MLISARGSQAKKHTGWLYPAPPGAPGGMTYSYARTVVRSVCKQSQQHSVWRGIRTRSDKMIPPVYAIKAKFKSRGCDIKSTGICLKWSEDPHFGKRKPASRNA